MSIKQQTIKEAVSLTGVGLHTGASVELTFQPASENHGIKFQRVDLPEQTIIDADCDLVVDTSRGTTLEYKGARVSTVEHVMAALAGLEIDNVLVQINGPEMPIMDGSSMPFVEALEKAGILEQDADREYFVIPHNVHYTDPEKGVEMIAMPVDDYRLTVMVDYNSSILGSQHASLTNIAEFKKELASCRTFCFLHELEFLLNQNLIKGGDLNNAIVLVDKPVSDTELDRLAQVFNKPRVEVRKEGILNNVELRFHNEPARHKLLDLVGDLALIGMPIRGQVMSARPGHAANVAFAQKIKQLIKKRKNKSAAPEYDPNKKPVFDINQISKLLPHKFPFLLVDKVIELSEKHVVAIKNVSHDQYFFQGHFPDNPLMPGVLQVEAMAQAGGVMVLSNFEDPQNYNTLFLKIDNARFKDMVRPGDTLVIKMEMTGPARRGVYTMKGTAYVGEKLVSEADLMAQIVKKADA